jgi:release factor glutamine methyltransferase
MLPTVEQVVSRYREELGKIYSSHEAFQFAWLIFEYLRGWSKSEMILYEHTKINHSEDLFIEKALERLKNHEPIQYVIGETEFFGFPLDVNPSVLVPRPETEELVEWIREKWDPSLSRILDIGTGSGCIAIALAKLLPGTSVCAWDISSKALSTALGNASKNNVRVRFREIDVFEAKPETDEIYDIIVSNPPYVRYSEKVLMLPNVLNFEPSVALFVDDSDPLIFYRKIASFARQTLVVGGYLYLEINRDFGSDIKTLLLKAGFDDVELRSDLSGNHRMVKAVK